MTNSGSNKSHLKRSKTSIQRKKKSECIGSDATEQKKPDDQGSKQEERYKTLIENIPCAVYSAFPGERGPTTFMSPNWKDWTGYSADELYKDPEAWPKCIYPDDREKAVNAYVEACKNEVSYNLEYRIVHRDTGQVHYVRDQGILSKDTKGTLIRVDGIITDITELKTSENELGKYRDHLEELVKERTAELEKANEVLELQNAECKKAEEMLRISEEKYRNMIELFPAVIVVINKLGFIVSCNNTLERITGYSKDELIGKHFTKLGTFRLKEVPKYLGLFAKVLKGGVRNPLEIDFIRRDGSPGTVEVHVSLLNDGKIQAVATNITDRKKAEETLRESENRYKAVVDNAQEGIVVVQDKMLKFVNPKVTSIMGCTEEELTSRPFIEFVHPEDRDRVTKIHLKRFKREEVPEVYEFRIVDKQDNTRWLESNGILIDWNGSPATLNFLRDITERKKTEEELKNKSIEYKRAQEIGKVGSFTVDFITREQKWSDEIFHILGLEPGEIHPSFENFNECVHPEDKELLIQKSSDTFAGKADLDHQYRIIRKDGEIRFIHTQANILNGQDGTPLRIYGFSQDITERKKAEEKILENQAQLKSLASQLSVTEERERRRIATELHDQIGQSLVFSKLKLDELHQTATSSELTKALDEICNNIDQVIQYTRTLTFDLSSPILNEIGLEAAVAEWLDVQIHEKYGIKTEFVDDGQQKPMDDDIRALLFRNVLELLVNVIKHADAQNVKVSISRVNEYVHIDVEDDGKGFDSVKAISTGIEDTKFGLFSIRQRLEQLGGQFEIDSEERRGSKIMMAAPLKLTISKK